MPRRAQISVVVFLLVALTTLPSVAAQDKTLLVRKAKVGDVTRVTTQISLTANMQSQQLPMEIQLADKSTVTEVAADGRITIKQDVESMSIMIAGNQIPAPPPPPADTIVTSPTRALVSYKSGEGDPAATAAQVRVYSGSIVVFSDKPVGVGDTWTRTIAADAAIGLQAAKAEFKVLAFEKVGELDTVKISMIYSESVPDGLQTTGTYWVDRATGEDVKGELEFKNMLLPEIGLTSGTVKHARSR